MSLKKSIPIVDVTCFGESQDVDEYAKNALDWVKKELVPKGSIFCPCLASEIYLSNNKVRHTIMHKKHDQLGNYNIDTISVLSELEQMIENAEVRYRTSDNKSRENYEEIIKLLALVRLNDEKREVELLIQKIYHSDTDEFKYHFYNHVLL